MIRLCTCTGGAASTLGLSRKRAATASCKACGGKPVVDGRESPASSMLSTVGLELTSLINSDLTWKKVSKGNRSASRRARKSVGRSLKSSEELVNKDPKRVDMPVSESEKLGVSVLGCRFSEKAEHVPIKKRRFLFRSPSPPPRTASPCPEETARLIKSASGQEFHPDSMAKCRLVAIDAAASAIDLGQIVDTEPDLDGKNSVKVNEQLDDHEDFSGISILAAAACSNSVGGDVDYAEEGSGVEESFVRESPLEDLTKSESSSLLKVSKEDLVNSAEISTEGTGSCISTVRAEELAAASLGTDNSSPKDLAADGNNMEGTLLRDNSVAVSPGLLSNNDDGTLRTHESSLRDDRSHWDLNTVMDAWERPFDIQYAESQTNVADSMSEDAVDGNLSDKIGTSEDYGLQREPGGAKCNVEKTLLPCDLRRLANETQESNIEEHKLDACTDIDGAICFQEKLISSKIDNTANVVMDLVKETKSLHDQEGISSNAGLVVSVPVEHAVGPSTSATVNENASSQFVTFGSTGNSESLSSHQVACMDSCVEYSLPPESDHLTSTCVSEGNCNAASTGVNSMKNINDSTADAQIGGTISSTSQVEKQEVALPPVAFSEKAACEIGDVLNEDGERISGLHDDDANVPKKMVSMDTGGPLGPGPLDDVVENAVFKSDEVGISQSSPKCAEAPTSGAFVGGQPVVPVDEKAQDGKVSVLDTVDADTEVHIAESLGKSTAPSGSPRGHSSHDACKSYSDDLVNSLDKVALEEPFDDSYDSDVSQDDPGLVVGTEKGSQLQVDYDSQYEDGELRESFGYTWEEYDGEDVDYGSDNRDTFDGADHHASLPVQVEGAEYKKQRFSNTNNFGSEDDTFMKNMQETNFQPFQRGLSMTKVIEAGSGKERAVKTSQECFRSQSSGKHNDEFDAGVKVDKEPGAGPDKVVRYNDFHARGDDAKEPSQSSNLKMKLSGWDRLPEGRRSSSAAAIKVRDASGRKNITGDCMDGLDAEDAETRVVSSRAFRRGLPSRIEGPASRDVFPRKDRLFTPGDRSNDADDLNSRSERESGAVKSFGRGRYSLHIHARGRGDDHWTDSSEGHRGLKRHHSPSYHGLTSFRRPGPDNAAAAAAKVENSGFLVASDGTIVKAGGVGPSGCAGRQSANPSSHGVHRPLTRSGSPSDRDEAFGIRMGIRPAGEMSPERCVNVGRGRSVRYGPRVNGRAPMGRYHGPVPDDCIEPSLNFSHPLARRERSFSPLERRGDPHARRSRTRSPSRSRTRSPNVWQSPRRRNGANVGGNPSFRNRSRSPNFRSEARMQRVRSPHQRLGFAADHMVDFMSIPRSHGSPPHTSRWIDGRKDGVVHFKEQGYRQRSSVVDRRSPGRMCPRGDRFDLADSPRKLKPNEYYRSMHPGRFSEMDGAGRGPRCEGSDDDRRKHGYRYGPVHPVRRYHMDGAVKRFRYDVEDGFLAVNNSRNKDATDFHGRGSPKGYHRGIDCRIGDVPRRYREEKGPFIYRRDGKYNANSKSFGMRECDEDVAPRRRRPS